MIPKLAKKIYVRLHMDRQIDRERKKEKKGGWGCGRKNERERGGGGKHINKFSKFVYNRV